MNDNLPTVGDVIFVESYRQANKNEIGVVTDVRDTWTNPVDVKRDRRRGVICRSRYLVCVEFEKNETKTGRQFYHKFLKWKKATVSV